VSPTDSLCGICECLRKQPSIASLEASVSRGARAYNVVCDPPQQRIQHLRGLLLREEGAVVRSRVDRVRHGQERLFPGQSSASTCILRSRHALPEEMCAFKVVESWLRSGSLLRNIGAVSWQGLSIGLQLRPKLSGCTSFK
jgi:hypothetical protein